MRIFALAFLYLLLVGALIFRVPLGQAPDEEAHGHYVSYIVEQRALPVFKNVPPPNYGYEFHQPPLYYMVCAPGVLMSGSVAPLLWCRIVSALFGLATLFCIWHAVCVLWPEREDIALLATGAAAIWPLHLGVSTAVSNDSAAGFFCAALFYLVARGAAQGASQRDVLLMGLCAGLGLATKTTTLPISVAAWGALVHLTAQQRAEKTKGLPAPLAMVLVAALAALPLFIRNTALYGDPLGWQAFSQAATAGTPGFPKFSVLGFDFVTYARGILLILFCTFWGFFGGPDSAVRALVPLNPKPFPPSLAPLALACVLATIIVVLGLLLLRRNRAAPAALRFAFNWWSIGVALVFLVWAQFAYHHFSGGQARYLHPALLPFCVLGALAWSEIFRGIARKITAALFALVLLALLLMNLFVWQTLV